MSATIFLIFIKSHALLTMNPSHSDKNDVFSLVQATMPANLPMTSDRNIIPANMMIDAHAFPKKDCKNKESANL